MSARESSISALVTELSMVNTSSTFNTIFDPERVNSGPATPSFAQAKPTAMMNTRMPIWVNTGVMSKSYTSSFISLLSAGDKPRRPGSYVQQHR